ncbi:MAG: capsule assembly Wzi family protein, partial [Gammaproteobacteria bacterium]|nr:capsule assembly Wzi family protein [Gammaproteobacteria bacterium]
PGDTALRSDLMTLADAGVLTSPMTTWPLPWGDVVRDLRDADVAALGEPARLALERVRMRVRQETRVDELSAELRVSASEKPRTIRTFDNTPRQDAEVTGALSWVGQRFAVELRAAYVSLEKTGPTDDDAEVRPDGSFAAVAVGNWMLVAGYPERWWGPAWDGSLILGTNARPTPQLAISRNSAEPFQTRWLRWMGPWSLTAFMGQLDDERLVDDALLFGMRLAFKPLPELELGFSRTAQWCGNGRPCDAEAFGNLLIGRDNRGENVAEEEEPGNQLAGFDIRWVPPWLGRSTALYAQWIGEDTRQGGPQIGSWMRQIGVEYSGMLFGSRWSHRTYVEYSDTICREGGLGFSKKKFQCAYEHGIYRTGYRYEGRSIGHGMDGQGTSFSIGSIWMGGQDETWQFSLRHIDTNQGATPRAGHTVSPNQVKVDEILAAYERPLWIGRLRVGLGYRDIQDSMDPIRDDASAFGWLEFVLR